LADILIRAPLITNARVTNIFGHKRVKGIEITKSGQTRRVECDSVIFTGNWIPENELARMGGLEIDAQTQGPKINAEFQSSVAGVFVAGNLLRGAETADRCALEGRRTGAAIKKYLKQ
jgi:thioredoxin reductase